MLIDISSSVSRANLSCVAATIFSSLAFLSTSVSMANLSCLLATTFSRYRDAVHRYRDAVHRNRGVAHRYRWVRGTQIQGRFSTTHFHHLASIFWDWLGTDSRCLLFLTTFSSSSCSFLFFLLYLFRVLSSAFLSSVLQSLKLYLL